jgi:outer membrane protein assembly factor BamB
MSNYTGTQLELLRSWLQIDSASPNHYELLGLDPFCGCEEEKVNEAAMRRVERLRQFILGPNKAFANQLIREVIQAADRLITEDNGTDQIVRPASLPINVSGQKGAHDSQSALGLVAATLRFLEASNLDLEMAAVLANERAILLDELLSAKQADSSQEVFQSINRRCQDLGDRCLTLLANGPMAAVPEMSPVKVARQTKFLNYYTLITLLLIIVGLGLLTLVFRSSLNESEDRISKLQDSAFTLKQENDQLHKSLMLSTNQEDQLLSALEEEKEDSTTLEKRLGLLRQELERQSIIVERLRAQIIEFNSKKVSPADMETPTSPPGTVAWSSDVRGLPKAPTIFAGNVIIGTDEGRIYSLDTKDGGENWRVDVDGAIFAPGCISKDSIYVIGSSVSSSAGLVYGLNSLTGEPLWEFPTTGPISASVCETQGGILCVGDWSKRFYLLSPQGREISPPIVLDGLVRSGAVVLQDKVIVGTEAGSMYCIDPVQGTVQWRKNLVGKVLQRPSVVSETECFVVTDRGNFYLINTLGNVVWEKQFNGGINSSVITDAAGNLIICTQDGKIYLLDVRQAKRDEYFELDFEVNSTPVLGDNSVLYIAAEKKICALDINSSEQIWSYECSDFVDAALMISTDGQLIVSSVDGRIESLSTSSNGFNTKAVWPTLGGNNKHSGRRLTD